MCGNGREGSLKLVAKHNGITTQPPIPRPVHRIDWDRKFNKEMATLSPSEALYRQVPTDWAEQHGPNSVHHPSLELTFTEPVAGRLIHAGIVTIATIYAGQNSPGSIMIKADAWSNIAVIKHYSNCNCYVILNFEVGAEVIIWFWLNILGLMYLRNFHDRCVIQW